VYFERRQRIIIWAVSLSVAAALFLLLPMQGAYNPAKPYLIPLSQRVNNGFAFALLVALSIPAVVEFNNMRWLRGVDANIPRLLKDVGETVKSGVPLLRALEEAAARDYGPVSKPLQAAVVRFKLTSDLEASLSWMGERLVRPAAKRMARVLVEAYQTGGKVVDVLDTSASLFTDLAEYRDERDAEMRPYVLIAYLGSAVFLAVSWVILVRFLGPLSASSSNPAVAQGGLLNNLLDMDYYRSILFWAATMEALIGGLVAGKIRYGRLNAGLVHSALLVAMTIAVFNAF